MAFSRVGSGNAGAGVEPFGCGGPLGTSGFTSTSCLFWTPTHANAAGMWDPGFNPPATNYVIELWCLPNYPGSLGGNGAWLFCSGSSGGVTFDLTNDGEGGMVLTAQIVPLSSGVEIGDPWVVDTNRWTHLAVVNDNGTNTFYVNGVQHGAPTDPSLNTVPAGDIYAGSAPGTQPTYDGYLDELRISTFVEGQFTTNDFLTRPLSPDITLQPQPTTVWNGGAAPFTTAVATDTSTTYQWQSGGLNISGATNSELYLNVVDSSSNNDQYVCLISNYTGIAVTSSIATLTVVAPNTADVAAYRTAVTSEPSLVAYYPVDGDTGSTLTDTVGGDNGTLEGTAEYDGRTNAAFGVRALRLRTSNDGDVTIPNSPVFEFASSNGTIEAIVDLGQSFSADNETIISEAAEYAGDPNPTYYEIQVNPAGTSLIYNNDALTTPVTWAVPVSLAGRAAHVAFVFTNQTVTAYADGLSLGTEPNPGFGSASGSPIWIGSSGGLGNTNEEYTGDIDELAIYSGALSATTIAIHNSKFLFGTNTTSPSIIASSAASQTLYAGGLVNVSVSAGGTAPLSYQWTSNSFPIPGQTTAALTLNPTTTNMSAVYNVTVSNPYGSTNGTNFTLTFVAPTNQYLATIMKDNPMALWQLDETNGDVAYDVAGGHDGAYLSTNELTFGQPGMPAISNSAVHFEGGYVSVPYAAVLNPQSAFSIEFWSNPDTDALLTGNTYVMGASQFRSGSARLGWALYDNNDGNGYEIQMGYANGVSHYAYGSADVPGDAWVYCAIMWDGTNTVSLYVENQLVGQNTQVTSPIYTPNASQPLVIGIRGDLNFPFNGQIQDFALYNYALSLDQISNHWSVQFVPPQITQQPVGVTNVEFSTITLSAGVLGYPNGYQWYLGGNPLGATLNPDGTAHYPNGVNGTNLVISEASIPGDSGTYYLAITNPLGDIVSSNVTVLVTPNTVPPSIVSVTALATPPTAGTPGGTIPFVAKVLFSARIDPTTGGDVANYSLGTGVTISNVTLLGSGPNDIAAKSLGADWREALLVTGGLTPGQQYGLTVSGLKDQSHTPLTVPTTTVNFKAPVLTTGMVNWDYYYLGNSQGGIVSALENDPNYQAYAPQTNAYLTALDTDQITGGDLNNNPIFGSLGDNYGDVTSGWITPAVTTNYTFFLWTDDAGELDLSSDSSPANASAIATEATAGSGFVETNSNAGGLPTEDSNPILLTAGQSYYIQILHAEGGGGDYAKVAWRMQGDTTAAKNLTPIPGTFLSTYAPGAVAPQFGTFGLTNGTLTLNWSGGTIQQSTDLLNWTNVPGNPSPLNVPVNSTTNTLFFRLLEP
ncbi:MAG TPA: LamG-like jellyroll fold domain-containing protein [Verrucomicrobiae bacterium]|jgi:hypothetical protein|nr:LamG-like jellyroll fold domain-containing protein [Verrucomicrobiae bacterium]